MKYCSSNLSTLRFNHNVFNDSKNSLKLQIYCFKNLKTGKQYQFSKEN